MTLTNRHSVWRFFSFILVSLFSHSLLDSCFLDRSGWSSVGLGVAVLLGTGSFVVAPFLESCLQSFGGGRCNPYESKAKEIDDTASRL